MDESVMDLYHESSKLTPSSIETFKRIRMVNEDPGIRRVIATPFPGRVRSEKVPLPARVQRGRDLLDVLDERRSVRAFGAGSVPLTALANVLRIANGETGVLETPDGVRWPLRSAPSPGGLFPTRIYCAALDVDGVPPGVHGYDVASGALESVRETAELRAELSRATSMDATFADAAFCLVLSTNLARLRFKYGERSYRFALLEAGHIAQNALLGAAYENLAAVAIGGFIDEAIRRLCAIEAEEELPLYLIAIGAPPA